MEPHRWESFTEGGGVLYDEQEYKRGTLIADLCELAQKFSFQHGAKIVNAILEEYDIKPKERECDYPPTAAVGADTSPAADTTAEPVPGPVVDLDAQ